jgi:hypothetical protein
MTIPDAPNICSAPKIRLAELFRADVLADLLNLTKRGMATSLFCRHSASGSIV